MSAVCFIVQADMTVGMGHLKRSASTIKILKSKGVCAYLLLLSDFSIHDSIKGDTVTVVREVPKNVDLIVFDCLNLPSALRFEFLKYKIRVLISPIFEHPELVTHVLSRGLDESFQRKLPSGTALKIEYEYGFANVSTESLLRLSAVPVAPPFIVGICLTGGGKDPEIFEILTLLCSIDIISEIRVKTTSTVPHYLRREKKIKFIKDTNNLWTQFAGINLFIGGDGLMLYEAVSKGVACLSLTQNNRLFKNKDMIEKGFVIPILKDKSLNEQVLGIFDKYHDLISMTKRIQAARATFEPNKLAYDLVHIINKERKND